MRAGFSRKTAAISLWGLSAVFAFIAILISNAEGSTENYMLISAVAVWVISFVIFLKTRDA